MVSGLPSPCSQWVLPLNSQPPRSCHFPLFARTFPLSAVSLHLPLASQIPLSVFRLKRDHELAMPCHATWNAGAALYESKPVKFDLDADEGAQVEYEFLCLGWLDEGGLEGA